MAKITLRKVTNLEIVGEEPKSLNGEIVVKLRCWAVAIRKPLKQNLEDDDSPIYELEVFNGVAEIE